MSSLNDIKWSEADLIKLANGNFLKTASSVVLNGVPTIHIMPFGISDSPNSVTVPAIIEGVEETKEDEFGFEDFMDDDFDDLVEGQFEGAGVAENVVQSFPRFSDGHEINYANIHRAGRFSFGISRKDFFYAQLDRMLPSFMANRDTYGSYQLSATFVAKTDVQKYGVAVGRNFGTTTVDDERRRVPHDTDVWPFDIHDPLNAQIDRPEGATIVSGDVVSFDTSNAEFVDGGVEVLFASFLEELKQSLDDKIPKDSDSGDGFEGTNRHMINLFLYKILLPNRVAGGAGLYDISKSTSNRASFSQKSVFSPKVTPQNTCFWECVAYFLYLRHYDTEIPTDAWYGGFVKGWVDRGKSISKNRMKAVKTRIASQANLFRLKYYEHVRESANFEKVPLLDFEKILSSFHVESKVVVLNEDGDAIVGDLLDVEKRRCESGDFTALWIDDHLHLILSYTGSLVVKKCRRCDARFSGQTSLDNHLESQKCMTCVCKEKGERFESEEEWLEHMRTREQTCPKYRLLSSDNSTVSSMSKESAKKIRFINDKHENYYQKRRRAQNEFDRDQAPMRCRKECIYFDLESVVPMNAAGVGEHEQERQTPYATGWILRTDALKGNDVEIRYGKDCMKDFVDYLDALYSDILEDEVNLWIRRASDGSEGDPIPRKTKGFENFSYRLRSHWDRLYRIRESDGCVLCGEPMEISHGYTIGENSVHKFSQCCIALYARSTAKKNLEKNFNDNAPRIPIWAHNGGKYDWVFLHRYLIETGKLDELETVRSNSKYCQ